MQDAMAIVRDLGNPHLFVTMTCNPNWPEIQAQLQPGQTANDIPIVVCRIFEQKIEALIDELYKDGIFGKAKGYVYTIEFQKRGLPHMHLLLILHPQYAINTPDLVDR